MIAHLLKYWEYRRVNQVGSHIILVTDHPTHHRLPIPERKSLGIGILKKILREVCTAKGITESELLRNL